MPHLSIGIFGGPLKIYELQGELATIGRHPESSLVLDDPSVSTRHAEIAQVDGRCILRDLESTNGTRVNEEPVAEVALASGDVIHFGSVEAIFEEELHVKEFPPQPALPTTTSAGEQSDGSFGSKVANLGRSAFGEAKRKAQIAGLHAKIEKLKLVDLGRAHYGLGNKCCAAGILRDSYTAKFNEIADLEKRIEKKRAGVDVAGDATTTEKIKRSAGNALMRAEAEALSLKRRQLLTNVGGEIACSGVDCLELRIELDAVAIVKRAIAALEAECSNLDADHSSRAALKGLSHSLAGATEAGSKALYYRLLTLASGRKRVALCFAIVVILILAVVAKFFYNERSDQWASGDLQPFQAGGKWGYRTPSRQIVMPPQFDRAEKFNRGRALVYQNRKYGYITPDGQSLGKMDSIDEVDFELLAKYAGIADKEIEKITRNFEGHSSLNVTGQPGTISHTDARAMAFGAIVALYEFGDITEVQVINPATHKVEIRKTILPDKANAEVKTPPWHPLD